MARVAVQKTRKDRKCGRCAQVIGKGGEYRSWTPYGQPTRVRCMDYGCTPRPSDLATNEKMAAVLGAQEAVEDITNQEFSEPLGITAEQYTTQMGEQITDIAETLRQAATDVREAQEEWEASLSNMQDSFTTNTPLMDEMEENISNCEQYAQDLEDAADAIEERWNDRDSGMLEYVSEGDVSTLDDPDYVNTLLEQLFNDLVMEVQGVDAPF